MSQLPDERRRLKASHLSGRIPSALICAGVATIIVASTALSQPLESPKKFYEKGFVLDGDKNASRATARESNVDANPSRVPQDNVFADAPPEVSPEQDPKLSSDRVLSFVRGEGVPIRSVRLLVESRDGNHFKSVYSDLMRYAQKLKLPILDIFVIGDASDLLQDGLAIDLLQYPLQPILRYFRSPPEPFHNIESSPTLAVETSTGVVLFEGYSSLGDFFNERGEIVRPTAAPASE